MNMKMMKPEEPKRSLIHQKISKTPVNKESIEGMTKDTDKMVSGSFLNIECQGQPAKISGKYYKGMEYFTKTFLDGEKCTIPLSVARWINERCCYEQHSHIMDEQGNPTKTGKKVYRYKFVIESMAA